MPVPTKTINLDTGNLFNWQSFKNKYK
jgi:hypothetical protein